MSVTSVLARLAPVSLEDIVEQAELLIRVDRKYLMARADAEMLVATVPADSQVLEIAGQRQFGYRSLYFDTARLDAYRGTAQRRRRRFKVRTRRYDTGAEFLEVKTRQASATVKHRIPSPASGLDLGVAGTAYVERQLAAAGVELTTALVATLWTSYTRSTLLLPADSARITIDTDLCWSSPHHDDRLLAGEGVAQFRCPIEQDGAFPSGEPHPQVVRGGGHRETVGSADRIVPVGSILRCVRGSGGTPQAGPDPHDHVGTALRVGGRNPEQRPKRFLQRLGAIEIELQVCVLRVSLGEDSRLRHGHGDTLPGKSSILATPDRSPRILTASSVRSLRKWWLPATKTSDGGATAMNMPVITIPWPTPWAVRNRGNTTRGARRPGWRRFVP